jgi:biofilm PGA synthesis N-glycosyltransferase PgaC
VTAVGLVALLLLVYTYAGYPLLVAALARRWPGAPVRRDPRYTPAVTVCLPVHDGAPFIAAKLRSLLDQDYPAERLEVLVHCDGCRDETATLARGFAGIEVREGPRRGKPHALDETFARARGELLLLTDVRQPLDRGAVRALAASFADPDVGCASGALRVGGAAGSGAYWRYERWIRGCESRFRGLIGATGALMMVRRRDLAALGRLPEGVILDDVLIPMKLRALGRRAILVDEAGAEDTAFPDGGEFRRKIRTLAGNFQLLALLPWLLSPARNPLWFETISHRVLRLGAPFLLLALLASAASGGSPWQRAALAAQLAGYGAALAGARAGRVGRLARTFVVLNAAAVVGLWRHLAGRQRVTW